MNVALSMNQMMRLVPKNIHPNYKDKVACDSVVACLVSLGTNYICVEDCQNQLSIVGGWTGPLRNISIGLSGFVAMAMTMVWMFRTMEMMKSKNGIVLTTYQKLEIYGRTVKGK